MNSIKIVESIKLTIPFKSKESLKEYNALNNFVEKDFNVIKILSKEILTITNSLDIDIPIQYSEFITKITIILSTIQTLKSNIILNKLSLNRIYKNAYYSTLHKYTETKKIGVKVEWKHAFNIALIELTKTDIYAKLKTWEQLIQQSEELYQSSMEIVQSGKKTLTLLMHNKW